MWVDGQPTVHAGSYDYEQRMPPVVVERIPTRVWPRDYPPEQVDRVLALVARGEFKRWQLIDYLCRVDVGLLAPSQSANYSTAIRLAKTTLRRAKLERRIRWCNVSHQYVARPAWQHRPRHDRRGWRWPR
jgi:hypothetical protein